MLVGILSPSHPQQQEVLVGMLDRMEIPHESVGAEAFVSRLGRYSALIVPSDCQALEDCTDEDIEEWLTPFTAEGGRVLLLAAGAGPSSSETAPKTRQRTVEIVNPDHAAFHRPNGLSADDLEPLGQHLRPSALPQRGGRVLLKCEGREALVETAGWGDTVYCADRRMRMLYSTLPLESLARGDGPEASVALKLLENLIWHTLFWNFMVGHGLYSGKKRRGKEYPTEISPRDLGQLDLKKIFQTPQPTFRNTLELDGVWRYSSDTSVEGETISAHDFNDAAWREVRLPNLAGDKGWFRTSFVLSREWQGHNLLLETGPGGEGEVWFNGRRAGVFVGASRLIQLLEPIYGERGNVLAIRSVGGPPSSFSMLLTSPVWIAEVLATPDLENSEVGVDVTLRNSLPKEANGVVAATCFPITKPGPKSVSEKLAFHIPPGKETTLHLLVPVENPLPWAPEHPDLYSLTTSLQTEDDKQDDACTTFGMRILQVKEGDLYLNGERRFLRGAVGLGWSTLEASWESTAQSLLAGKFMGADFSRMSAPDERVAALCDSLGIMIVQGIGGPIGFHPLGMKIVSTKTGGLVEGWQKRATGIVKEDLIRRSEIIARHVVRSLRHHPSVVMWEFSNEVPVYLWEVWQKIYPRLMEVMHELDPERRPVVASSWASPCDRGLRDAEIGWDMPESEAARRLFAENEEIMYTSHMYCGWYNDRIQTIYQLPASPPDRPLGLREFGAESLPDFSTLDISPRRYNISNLDQLSLIKYWSGVRSNLEDYRENSQQYQAIFLRTFLDHFRSMKPQVDDVTIFMWMDNFGRHKGILDIEGRPKKAFWEAKEAFAPLMIAVQWPEKVVFVGETVSFPLAIVNDRQNRFFAALKWDIHTAEGTIAGRGREEIRIEGDSVQRPSPVTWEIPAGTRGGFYYLQATLESLSGQSLCTRDFEFQVVPRGIAQ